MVAPCIETTHACIAGAQLPNLLCHPLYPPGRQPGQRCALSKALRCVRQRTGDARISEFFQEKIVNEGVKSLTFLGALSYSSSVNQVPQAIGRRVCWCSPKYFPVQDIAYASLDSVFSSSGPWSIPSREVQGLRALAGKIIKLKGITKLLSSPSWVQHCQQDVLEEV